MDSALTGLVILILLVVSVFTMSYGYLTLRDGTMRSFRVMEARMNDRVRTDLTPLGASTTGGGALVEITLRNEGETKLADFGWWDVIVEYNLDSDAITDWLPYNDPGEDRYWIVKDIYLDASSSSNEVFEPNILNPGEEIIIQVWLSPTVELTTTNLATIVTPNGISASQVFTY